MANEVGSQECAIQNPTGSPGKIEAVVAPYNPSDNQKLIAEKQRKFFANIMKLFVVFLGLVIVAVVLTSVVMSFTAQRDSVGSLSVDIKLGNLLIDHAGNKNALKGLIGKGIIDGKIYKRRKNPNELFYEWLTTASLQIEKDSKFKKCFKITWSPGDSGVSSFQDCYSLSGQYFYGGSELFNQTWPLHTSIPMQPYIPQDMILESSRNKTSFGPVLERYWLGSNGIAIIVDDTTPLHVSYNENHTSKICLKADLLGYPSGDIKLAYRLCVDKDIRTLQQYVMGEIFRMPQSIPDERMMVEPVWSTSSIYGDGVSVNQKKILDFAETIYNYKLTCSQIEIDNMYTTTYGDNEFDSRNFSNVTEMISTIHGYGYRMTLWVHPFANTNSKGFLKYVDNWIKGGNSLVPGLVQWWMGIASALDTTNKNAFQSFVARLKSFQEKYQIDGFKFVAGSLSYIPYDYKFFNKTVQNPAWYSSKYAELGSKFGRLVSVRVGYQNQELPIFTRILDRHSTWSPIMGIKSVIPSVLTLGVLGYPFVLPGGIGGKSTPSKELYIRWVQLNTFLPAMQFSVTPWYYDNETVSIAKKFIALRKKISPVIVQEAKKISSLRSPIIQPLWWLAPRDETSLKSNSQFIVGGVYLVAPVLDPLSTHKGVHRVYFPPGYKWKRGFGSSYDIIDATAIGKWVTFNVSLEDLPYFSMIKNAQV